MIICIKRLEIYYYALKPWLKFKCVDIGITMKGTL